MAKLSVDMSALPLLQGSEWPQPEGSRHLSSTRTAFGNVLISIVGAGVLGLPYVFKTAGWMSTCLVLPSVALACYYGMMLLVWSRRRLEEDADCSVNTYSDLGFVTFGEFGRLFVDALMVLSQGAFCVAYLMFMGENMAVVVGKRRPILHQHAVSYGATDGLVRKGTLFSNFIASRTGVIWVILPFQVALASLHSLTALAPFSVCADIINVAAISVIIEQSVATFAQRGIAFVTASQGLSTIPFAVGVSIYAFEAIGLVLPLESSMRHRKSFGGVLGMAMVCVVCLYVGFGLLGYMAFGEETHDIVTLNLGINWRTAMVRIGLCFGLFFALPIMMHPVHEVLERRLVNGRRSMVVRATLVLLAVVTAILVPHFGNFLSLVGSSCCCLLAFVLPALIHIKAHKGELSKFVVVLNSAIFLFGVGFGIWGTYSALVAIIKGL